MSSAGDYECARLNNGVRCAERVCACSYDTVQLANLACLPRAKHLGDKCILSEQCKTLDSLATCYVSVITCCRCICIQFDRFSFRLLYLQQQDTCMCEPIYHVAGDLGSGASLGYGGRQSAVVGCLKSTFFVWRRFCVATNVCDA